MTTWPMLLDMSRDECKRVLRRLELEAYGSLVSALRAQGELSREKRKLLQDLASTLNISMERHRAEVRRAVNDEKLTTIAEHIAGPNTATDWAVEGRRLVPLMPRLVPQTMFTALANNVANIAAAENARLPPPGLTARKSVPGDEMPTCEPNVPEATKTPQRSVSPVLSSVQLKKDDDEEKSRKRRRSSSVDGPGIGQPPSPTLPPPKLQVPNIPVQQPARTVTFPMGMTPVKITLTTTPSRATITTTSSASSPATQKVIIVSSSTASGSPSILQRSLSVPIVKTVSATGSSNTASRAASLIMNSPNNTPPNIVTISTNPGSGGNVTATTVSIGGIPTAAYITSQSGIPKIRPKSVQLPAKPRPRSSSIVIPMTPNQIATGTPVPNVQGVQLKPSLHMRQEPAGMKIMPIPGVASATKILPKPSGQAPVYVMSATTASMSMVSRSVPANSTARVVSVSTSSASGATTHIRPVGPATFIAKNPPKPVQTVHISAHNPNMVRPAGGKPNVIVVQKGSASGFTRGIALSHAAKEVLGKVIVSKSVPATPLTTMAVQKPAVVTQQALNLPPSTTQGNVIVLDLSQEQLSKNTVLAEILQASGILSDSSAASSSDTPSKAAASEWVELDGEERPLEVTAAEDDECTSAEADLVQKSAEEMSLPVTAGRVVTLEEAVELLGRSDTALLSQAGIHVADTGPGTPSVQTAATTHQNVGDPANPGMVEVIGELDPQTGIYSIHQPSASGEGHESTRKPSVRIVSAPSALDIFSTALASADINLDSFQYLEEGAESADRSNKQMLRYTESTLAGNAAAVESVPKETSIGDHLSTFLQPGPGDSTAVTVEPSNMDTTGMHIEDFTSQRQDIT